MSILRLAIPKPLHRLYDYLPPAHTHIDQLQPGVRIKVPFGAGSTVGFLQEVVDQSPVANNALKQADLVLDERPLLPKSLHELLTWAARYYHHPLGEVYSSAFPGMLRKGKTPQTAETIHWALTRHGNGLPQGALARAKKQAQVIATLQQQASAADTDLRAQGISAAVLRALEAKQLIERVNRSHERQPWPGSNGLALNAEQQVAVNRLRDQADGFSVHALEGVTGSGKTEVYLQFIDDCLRRARQVLVLIPEIGLTPQTLSRFTHRFGEERVRALHSGLSDAERARSWLAAGRGDIDIVLGTRSAIFTPLARPGAIIVDEEHDSAYKQQDGFRYHARDLAVKRGQLENIPVILGSATPSLETAANVTRGRYTPLRLTERAGGARPPVVSVVDIREQALQAGLGKEALCAIDETLQAGQQVLLFVPRRGFAPGLRCHDCGWIANCHQCDARLTLHRQARHLRCHHCESRAPIPDRCPQCNSIQLLTQGVGTEQSEAFLRQRYPDTPVFRVDSDTVSGRDALQNVLHQINKGGAGLLVGTQMLSKGHHFPDVTLVIIQDADGTLFSPDFRGEERLAQLLTQVAGRAGRATLPGRVLLQTHYPHHPAIAAIVQQDYHGHSNTLLSERKDCSLPPFAHMVLVHADAPTTQQSEEFLSALKAALSTAPSSTQVIGPLPSPMQRRAGLYRSQLTLLDQDRKGIQTTTQILVEKALATRKPSRLRWFVDVDPIDMG